VLVLRTGASPPALGATAVRLAARLRRHRPDVVHANGVKAALVAVAAAHAAFPRRPVPVVWMKHDVRLDGRRGRALAARCAAVVCVSREVQRGLDGAARSSVIHPGVRVDPEQAAHDAVALRRDLEVDGPAIAVIGRLDPAKGHAELVEVLPDLLRAVPTATALLVGPDDVHHPGVRDALRRRAEELGVARSIRLPGHLPAAAVLAASDALCVPTVPRPDGSGREGFGLVAAQALALGVPVVGHDTGATAEVVGDCARLVRVGDRAVLAHELVQALTDPRTRAEAAACGRARARQLTVERMGAALLDVYRAVSP
jgi:glycosyltransferase involved in cell wall biosynthesis